jgi:hypothetical protein
MDAQPRRVHTVDKKEQAPLSILTVVCHQRLRIKRFARLGGSGAPFPGEEERRNQFFAPRGGVSPASMMTKILRHDGLLISDSRRVAEGLRVACHF